MITQLISFIGYGNPAGRFWFIGMEERGSGTTEELAWRASFAGIEDLIEAHKRWSDLHPDDPFDPARLVPTWSIMSKIALRLGGAADWDTAEAVRYYQENRLGRRDGETFLAEVLPLPAPNLGTWPYVDSFPDRDAYVRSVWPTRRERLRELFAAHKPSVVVCYGKDFWPYHQDLFSGTSFMPTPDGVFMLGHTESTTIALSPFFAPFLVSNARIGSLAMLIAAGRSSC